MIGMFIKTHQEGLTEANRGSPQITRWTQQMRQESLVVRRILFHVEGDDVLSFGNDDLVSAPGQF
jgi:hypothetical protein